MKTRKLLWLLGGAAALALLLRRKAGSDLVSQARAELEALPSDYTANLVRPNVGHRPRGRRT